MENVLAKHVETHTCWVDVEAIYQDSKIVFFQLVFPSLSLSPFQLITQMLLSIFEARKEI